MGVFLAQGDVGTDEAVEKVVGMAAEQHLQHARQAAEGIQGLGAELQMNADAPGQGLAGQQQKYEGEQ